MRILQEVAKISISKVRQKGKGSFFCDPKLMLLLLLCTLFILLLLTLLSSKCIIQTV